MEHFTHAHSTLLRPCLGLPLRPGSVELVSVWHVPEQVIVDVARVCVDTAQDAAVRLHALSKAGPVGCEGKGG